MPPVPNPSVSMSPVAALGQLNDVELRNAPDILFLAGDPGLLRSGPRVAIVGARKASREGQLRAMRLARVLVDHGITIVSGLAEGVDTAAHLAAIDRGGRTIAVLGTPLSRAYPASNQDLQERIRREHLLVSQFPEDEPVHRHNFVLRNRTMALIAHASVIVEASDTSGSLSQGREALRLGRPLFLMKSVLDDPRLAWPREMMHFGAHVLAEPEDVLCELPPERFAAAIDAPF
ncbi:MAG: DNA-processing protein DprA [Planctomycetota bacterium]|nr:DNA-processing protein DprA [Planctomycetota bacterium]